MQSNPFELHQPTTLAEEQLRSREARLYEAVNELVAFVTALQKCSVEGLEDCLRTLLPSSTGADAQEACQLVQLALQKVVCPALQEIHIAVTDIEFNDPAIAAAQQLSRSATRPPHTPRGMLSVVHMRYVYTALELVWCWGLAPALQNLVPQPSLALPKAILVPAPLLTAAQGAHVAASSDEVASYVSQIARITLMDRFMPLLLERYLGKMILACLLLSRQLLPPPTDAAANVGRLALDHLLNIVPSPAITAAIKHLLIGAGKYQADLRNDISALMTTLLLRPGGLATVIEVYLGGIGGITDENSKANIFMAKTLAAVPANMSAADYYENLGVQIIELLQAETRAEAFKARVISLLLARMCFVNPKEADEKILQPALRPFLAHEAGEASVESTRREDEIATLVSNAHTILLSMPAQTPVLQAFESNGTIRSIFEVFCCAWRTKSAALKPTEEILRAYLTNTEVSVNVLAGYALRPPHSVEAVLGGSGGVEVRELSLTSDDQSLNLGMLKDLASLLDENDAINPTAFATVLGEQLNDGEVSGSSRLMNRMGEVKRRFEPLVGVVQALPSRAGQLFVHLLRIYMEEDLATVGRRLSLSVGLLIVVESLGPATLETGLQILQVLTAFLRWGVQQMSFVDEKDPTADDAAESNNDVDVELLVTILGLLTTILELGHTERTGEEEAEFRNMLDPLATLSKSPNVQVADMAVSVRLSILTRSLDLSERTKAAESRQGLDPEERVVKAIQDAEADLQSPHPALRARGVVSINRVVRGLGKITPEGVIESVESILISMLGDPESYVYLAAVQALSTLSNAHPATMIPRLTRWLVDGGLECDGQQKPGITLDQRTKIGEALLFAVKRAGETMPKYCGTIVYALLRCCRQRSSAEPSTPQLTQPERRPDVEEERDDRASNWTAYYQAMDLIHFRTGCISLLAEVIGTASWAAAPYIRDVFDLAFGVMVFESSSRKSHVHAKRAAAYLLFECMNRLRETLFEIARDQLIEYYRWLKQFSGDPDRIVAYHAQRALGEMDTVVRSQLFPDPKGRNEQLSIKIL